MNMNDLHPNLLQSAAFQSLEIVQKSHKLPPIVINKENRDTYDNYFECVREFSDGFGKNVIMLFSCVCVAYDIDPEALPSQENPHKNIIEKFVGALALLSASHIQANEALVQIKSFKDFNVILNGDKFCLIVHTLKYIFELYLEMMCIYRGKKPFRDKEFSSFYDSLKILTSTEMEELKKAFKVIECFECLEDKMTLH